MADISNVINVTLLPEGQATGRDNMNIVALLTPERGNALSSRNRYMEYKDINSVANDFGTFSKTYDFAAAVFAQSPNPVNSGGSLIIGYHRAAEEAAEKRPARLTGGVINETTVISALQRISDGSMSVTANDTDVVLPATDFRTAVSISDVIKTLSAALQGVTVSYINRRIIIESATGEIGFTEPAADGTFIGDILSLSSGSGAIIEEAETSSVLPPETQLEAVQKLKSIVNFKGLSIIDEPTDEARVNIAEWAQANNTLVYETFRESDNLLVKTDNIVWQARLAGLTNFRMLYSKSGNRKIAAAYMSRMHSVNFNAENSAITMNLKTLAGITSEDYNQTELSNAVRIGLDIYTTIKNVPCLLVSGSNDYTDNRYNLIAMIDAVQTDAYNLLKATATKIPQTQRGVNQIVDTVEKTLAGYVRCGVIAAGEWTSPDGFGDIDVLKRSVAAVGYYVLAGQLSEQSAADRQARKSPVIQCAVKNAGAIHSADIIIFFNY
ncbi:MAG: DUF3383 domain-containing protein [Deferribacteraceae bacterium]|jgi:hypothetical protein|nr:DUF3383 domain-containing protein [Deferribacteraceae bacterium]